jgi:hypothetical protein
MKTKRFAIVVAALVTICLVGGAALADDSPVLGNENLGNSLKSPVLSVQTYQYTVSLGWTSVAGATGYTLSYAPYPYTGPDTIKDIDMGTKRSIAVDLPVGAAYYVAVKAYDSSGSSGYSNIEQFTIVGVACVVSTDDSGTAAIASVGDEDSGIENAVVTVNDVVLNYGVGMIFLSEGGFYVDVFLPIYYAELNQYTYGDTLHLTARMHDGTMIYDRSDVIIPGRVTLEEPTQCQIIGDSQDVQMKWDKAANAEGYVADYTAVDDFDQQYSDDAGFYAAYVDASTTEAIVPSAYTLVGNATFDISPVTGDTWIFTSEADAVKSFFVATTWDSVNAKVVAAVGNPIAALGDEVIEDQGSEQLRIVKTYNQTIKKLKFKVRECDPNQIQKPGTITFKFKLHSMSIAVAFMEAYDMNGQKYYSWSKKRIFKTSSKTYYPSFSASPGTTVIFGTTSGASERGRTYDIHLLG